MKKGEKPKDSVVKKLQEENNSTWHSNVVKQLESVNKAADAYCTNKDEDEDKALEAVKIVRYIVDTQTERLIEYAQGY